MGAGRTRAERPGPLPQVDTAPDRREPEAAPDRLRRPVPDPPSGSHHSLGRDSFRSERSRPQRKGEIYRVLDEPSGWCGAVGTEARGVADRRDILDLRGPWLGALRVAAAALQHS